LEKLSVVILVWKLPNYRKVTNKLQTTAFILMDPQVDQSSATDDV